MGDVEKYIEEEKEIMVKSSGNKKDKSFKTKSGQKATGAITNDAVDPYGSSDFANPEQEEWEEFIKAKKKDLPDLGREICVSSVELLTEPEAEYQAEVIKRVYSKYIVLQFNIAQSIESQLITDVYVDIDYDESPIINVTCPVIKSNSNENGICLAIIERGEDDDYYMLGKFECVLKFIVKDDIEEDVQYDEGYEDDYTLNQIVMHHFDYIYPAKGDDILSTKKLKETWNEIGKNEEERKKGSMNFKSLQPAVHEMVKCVGLSPVEESNRLDDEQALQHGLNLIAYTDQDEPICMRAAFVLNDDNVSYKAAVRCRNEILRSECLASF